MGVEEERVKGFTPTWTSMATSKLCDSCKSATANLFCRPDSAFLCIPCDSKIHAVNKLASRHARVWMCEVCEQAPSHVTCKADAAALCITCDRDIHSANPLARRHERFPVTPFYDSAVVPNHHHEEEGEHHFSGINNNGICNLNNVIVDEADEEEEEEEEEEDAEEATSWLIPNPTGTGKMIGSPEPAAPLTNYNLYPDVDPYLDLEYGSMDTKFQPQQQDRQKNQEEQNNSGTTDGVVPVQSKNHHVHQGSFVNGGGSESCFDFDFMRSNAFPYYNNNNNAQSLSQSVSSSSHDVGVVPDGGAMIDVSNPFGRQYSNVSDVVNQTAAQVPGIDREAKVLRYREKRKNRKFEKTIRYASRKAYAETRPRIKGRFAKRSEIDVVVDQIYGSSPALIATADTGYGVVPTF